PEFNARFDACAKTYRYRIWNDRVANPFERRYTWHIADGLDVDAMARAAAHLAGRHDFAAFQSTGSDARTTERTVFACAAHRLNDALVVLDIRRDGFLRHMVRAIAGTLVEVGRGRHPPEWMGAVLASRDRALAGPTAPAAGLFLVSVDYGSLADEP